MKFYAVILIILLNVNANAAQFSHYSYSELYVFDNQDIDSEVSYNDQQHSVSDPLKAINKHIFNFNLFLDAILLSPVSKAYTLAVPQHGRKLISNFLANLGEPINFFNLILQKKFTEARTCFARFLTNSTVGFLGTVDFASNFNLPYKGEDFGQTLAHYGFYNGIYIVTPVFGPSTMRDFTGKIVDFFADPSKYSFNKRERFTIQGGYAVTKRAEAKEILEIIKNSLDPYETAKQLYIQNRNNQINK